MINAEDCAKAQNEGDELSRAPEPRKRRRLLIQKAFICAVAWNPKGRRLPQLPSDSFLGQGAVVFIVLGFQVSFFATFIRNDENNPAAHFMEENALCLIFHLTHQMMQQ